MLPLPAEQWSGAQDTVRETRSACLTTPERKTLFPRGAHAETSLDVGDSGG